MDILFSLKNVNFKDILRYPDLEIREGGVICISGKSGSGKSTLLRLLNGVFSPTQGEICYRGKNLLSYEPLTLRREILLVSQSAYLFDDSVENNFRKFCEYLDLPAPTHEQMHEFLRLCCADEFDLNADTTVFSGGERQRVFLGINLSLPSKVIMLDEPTSALDSATADTLMTNIKDYCREHGKTLILVSHDAGIVGKFADEVISL